MQFQATESVVWIRRSVAAVRPMMSNASVAHMQRCVRCIEEVARLAPEGGPLAAYRFLPQILEYVRCMRDPFHMSLQTGELRGLTMVELHAARIILVCYHLWVSDIFDYFFVTARPSQTGNKVPVMSLVLFLDIPEKYSNQKSPRHFTGTGVYR